MEGKYCLITGSTGIAGATAELAVQEGAYVLVTSRSLENGEKLIEHLDGIRKGAAGFFRADLVHAEEAEKAIQTCLNIGGRIDALFNVAGISGRRHGDGPVHECTEQGWDTTMETNVKSHYLMTRGVVQAMRRQDPDRAGLRGTILNMTSVLGYSPSPRYFDTHAYAAGKGAIISLTRAMAATYAPEKIRVNAIAPALVRTPMSARAQQDPAIIRLMQTKQPLRGDLIEPESVAQTALFLLGDEARDITGQVLSVDAGWGVSEGQDERP